MLFLFYIQKLLYSNDLGLLYRFSLYASPINYQYDLFDFYHTIELYPVAVRPDSNLSKEVLGNFQSNFQKDILAGSETEFMEILKKIFTAPKTRQIIANLLAQLQVEKDDDNDLDELPASE